jgi:colanic acid/amylovoran biosynthesis glycosyltransferase
LGLSVHLMKIGFFLNAFPVSSETFILNQIVGLIRRGHDLDIHVSYCVEPSNRAQHADIERYRLLGRIRSPPIPEVKLARLASATRRVALWGWRRPAITLDSLNVLRHGRSALNLVVLHDALPALDAPQRYDVIHCHYGPNGQRAVVWRYFGALVGPIITTFHGYDVNLLPRIERTDVYKRLFQKGELFTVGSEFTKKRVVALGAPKERVVKLPMGVDLSRFRFTERVSAQHGGLRLLTVARLVEVKGIEYAIRAVASLRDKYSGIRYQIAGDGPLRPELERLAAQLGIADKTEFLGALPQERIIELYQDAHFFVLPGVVTESGEEEGQSLVLAEAQACGLPVIASKIGGIPENLRDGESGLLVPPGDAAALARAIEDLAEGPQVWGRMGRLGRAFVEKHFDLERLNDRLVALYDMVLARA